eukprot:Skav236600  [mRNA]  locus=scaffold3534:100863:101351:- [translate_table: standard]
MTSGCLKIVPAYETFAVLKDDGTVVSGWGDLLWDQQGTEFADVEASLTDVVDIFSAEFAFAALKSDGSIITWGQYYNGGDTTYPSDISADLSSLDLCGSPTADSKHFDGSWNCWLVGYGLSVGWMIGWMIASMIGWMTGNLRFESAGFQHVMGFCASKTEAP